MNASDFIARLEQQNAKKKTHKLGKPATEKAIADWQKKHPQFPLPGDFVELLKRANGFTLSPDRYTANGAMRLFAIKETLWAPVAMYGEDSGMEEDFPESWLAIGADGNGDWSPLLDCKTGHYRISSHITPGDSDQVLDSLDCFLDWILESLLNESAAESAADVPVIKAGSKIAEMPEVRVFAGHRGRVLGAAVSPDGKRLVTCSFGPEWYDKQGADERTLRLWDVESGQQILAFEHFPATNTGNELAYETVAISPDGRQVIAGTHDGHAFVFDAQSGARVGVLEASACPGTIRYSPDGTMILLAGGSYATGDGVLHLFDAVSHEKIKQIDATAAHTLEAVFTPDSRRIFAAAWDKSVRVWDIATGKQVDQFPKQKYPWATMALSPDGRRLLAGSWTDRAVTLWDVAEKKLLARFEKHVAIVQAIAFSADGCRALTLDGDSAARFWDVENLKPLGQYLTPQKANGSGRRPGTSVCFMPDGRHGLLTSFDCTARMFRLVDAAADKKRERT